MEFTLTPPELVMLAIVMIMCLLAGYIVGIVARDFGLNRAGLIAGLAIGVGSAAYAWLIWPSVAT